MEIKNIIFDLGEVILGVDTVKTKLAFEKLGVKNFNELYTLKKQEQFFDDFEKGYLTDVKFRNEIRQAGKINLSDIEIDTAWNAMLGDLPQLRFNFLNELKNQYRIFLLSNTNIIHWRAFENYFDTTFGIGNFEKLFESVYYSFETGMRKPDAELYEMVLQENNLVPGETLFVDDNEKNIEGSKIFNLQTHLHSPQTKIEEYLINRISQFAN